jgi:hypothetical protein
MLANILRVKNSDTTSFVDVTESDATTTLTGGTAGGIGSRPGTFIREAPAPCIKCRLGRAVGMQHHSCRHARRGSAVGGGTRCVRAALARSLYRLKSLVISATLRDFAGLGNPPVTGQVSPRALPFQGVIDLGVPAKSTHASPYARERKTNSTIDPLELQIGGRVDVLIGPAGCARI